jgi:hypothetical protein
MIDAKLAWDIRSSGRSLPVDESRYVDIRIAEIAKRQYELMQEHNELDNELFRLVYPPQSPSA